jgi:hypothetical protein
LALLFWSEQFFLCRQRVAYSIKGNPAEAGLLAEHWTFAGLPIAKKAR